MTIFPLRTELATRYHLKIAFEQHRASRISGTLMHAVIHGECIIKTNSSADFPSVHLWVGIVELLWNEHWIVKLLWNEHWCQFHHSWLFYLIIVLVLIKTICFFSRIGEFWESSRIPEEHLSQAQGAVAGWIGHVYGMWNRWPSKVKLATPFDVTFREVLGQNLNKSFPE